MEYCIYAIYQNKVFYESLNFMLFIPTIISQYKKHNKLFDCLSYHVMTCHHLLSLLSLNINLYPQTKQKDHHCMWLNKKYLERRFRNCPYELVFFHFLSQSFYFIIIILESFKIYIK
jgi:hypothetical protein